VFSDSVRTTLAPALHGDSSGVRGAAWLGRYRELSPPAQHSGGVISSSFSSVASSWKSP
jgi:hypothetical protein